MAGNEVAEVIRAARIPALAHHGVEAAGRKFWEFLQGLQDEGQIGVNLRGALLRRGLGQPGLLRDHPPHHPVMDVQLCCNGGDRPFFGVIIAQDLGGDIRRRHHWLRPQRSLRARASLDGGRGGAETLGEPAPHIAGRTNGSA
jgi:hypothetical protein